MRARPSAAASPLVDHAPVATARFLSAARYRLPLRCLPAVTLPPALAVSTSSLLCSAPLSSLLSLRPPAATNHTTRATVTGNGVRATHDIHTSLVRQQLRRHTACVWHTTWLRGGEWRVKLSRLHCPPFKVRLKPGRPNFQTMRTRNWKFPDTTCGAGSGAAARLQRGAGVPGAEGGAERV